MRNRLLAGLCTVLLALCGAACAETVGPTLPWPERLTPAQTELAVLVARMNVLLMDARQRPFNTLFECYPTFAVLGVTMLDQADEAEGVELTAQLSGEHISRLDLRVSDLRTKGYDRFPTLAGVLLAAVQGGGVTPAEAAAVPTAMADKAQKTPDNSFGDPISEQPGESVRTYYTYSPGMYEGDTCNALTLTLIIPLEGLGGPAATPAPYTPDRPAAGSDDYDADFEGYNADDSFEHFSISVTPTPEPVIEY